MIMHTSIESALWTWADTRLVKGIFFISKDYALKAKRLQTLKLSVTARQHIL